MASGYSDAEQKINLSVLQQKDPYITGIADSASQVAAYSFNAALNEWEKTNIEGTLFVYTRSAFPLNGFMIINRLHLNDLIEPINKNLEFQLQDPFLLYKNSQSAIYGIWFYDRDECARIGQLMNSLVQVATDTQNQETGRQRRASESDTIAERPLVVVDTNLCSVSPQKNNVDILQMLSKAQDEYDKSKTGPSRWDVSNKDVDQMSAILGSSATCPSPSKRANGASPSGSKHYASYNGFVTGQGQSGPANHQQNSTHISLEALFKKAIQSKENMLNDQRLAGVNMKSAFHMPPIPLSNQATPTVEEIERAQRESTAGNMGLPLVAGLDPKPMVSEFYPQFVPHHCDTRHQPDVEILAAPESPNTALRRTLKIIPPLSCVTSNNLGRPLSVTNREAVLTYKQADLGQPAKQQPTVIQTLFQQSGRNSSQSIPQRTSISSLIGGSQIVSVQRPLLPSSNEMTRSQQWEESMPLLSPSEKLQFNYAKQVLGRQTSVESLAKPDTFTATAAKNAEPGIFVYPFSTTLLSPMAFQTPGKLIKANVPAPETMDMRQRAQNEALILIRNHVVPRTPTPIDVPPPITPLSKEQLREALINLLRTDNSFITAIHEAYTASLNRELFNRHPGRREE